MTDYSSNADLDTIQIALLSNPNIARPDSAYTSNDTYLQPIAYEFSQQDVFPELAEWSRHSPTGGANSFEGISFKSHYYKANVTLTLSETNTGFKNIFGKYTVDQNGIIQDAQLLTNNTREVESGAQYSFVHESTEENLQFFLIANGHSYNKQLDNIDEANSSLKFVSNLGTADERLAKITDDPSQIDLVYKTHEEIVSLNGKIFHTSNQELNADNKSHSISGVVSNEDLNTLRIGFEDFPNLGDGDFNDLIVDVEIFYIPTQTNIVQSFNHETVDDRFDDALSKQSIEEINKDAPLIDDGAFSPDSGLYTNNLDDYLVTDLGTLRDLGDLRDIDFSDDTVIKLFAFENVIQQGHEDDIYLTNFVTNTTQPPSLSKHDNVSDNLTSDAITDVVQYDETILTITDIV